MKQGQNTKPLGLYLRPSVLAVGVWASHVDPCRCSKQVAGAEADTSMDGHRGKYVEFESLERRVVVLL